MTPPPDTTPRSNARAELTAGVTVSGTVTLSGRTGQYVFRAPVTQFVRLFLQARSGRAADTLVAAVKDSTGKLCCWSVASAGSDTSLTAQGSDWFQVGAGDPMYVDVTGLRPDDSGAFSLLLYVQDTRPEKLGPRITIGDTVSGESIDLPGDVDDFYFTAQAGEELVLFAQAKSALELQAVLSDSATASDLAHVTSTGQDTSLLGQPSQRLVMAKTGTYRVEIVGLGLTHGPYRLFVARVNRAPEHAASTLAPGDTSGYENIDFPGDIDEFSFAGVAGTEINVLFQPVSGLTGTMHLELLQDGQALASGSVEGPTTSLEAAATGTVTLPSTGQYTVRVYGEVVRPQAAAMGRYRFELYRIDRRPEHAAVLAPIGTTVLTEALEKPGDIDEFRIPAAPGKSFAVALRTPDAPAPPICVNVVRGDSLLGWPAGTQGYGCGAWTMQGYTNMIAAPDTGSYTLRVFAPGNYYGRYSFEIYPLSTAPETLPATFAPGVPVAGERMDRAMDVDTFTFAGMAGQYVNVFLRRDAGYTGQLHLLLQSAAMPIYNGWWGYDMAQVGGGSSTLDSANAGRLKLPVTGLYKIVTDGYSASETGPPGVGPYSFLLFPIDSRPEGRSASFAIGDTVREAIYPSGDIDEYTFSGNAGDRLSLNIGGDDALFQAGLDPTIYDPTGKPVLRAFRTSRSWDVDLQVTGTYTVRVWVPDGNSWQVFAPIAMGSYWLALTRRP